ncbi:UNVERIFIED_ORG: DivIVA domain-containing protein [Arthrobacter sp. UYEF10]
MSFFLVYLAIALIAATLWAGAGGRRSILGLFRRGSEPGNSAEVPENPILYPGFGQPPANLPPVLLPAEAVPADVDRVRFSLGLRGYRMDQVDQVLDELRDQIEAKDEEVGRLRARLLESERAAHPEAGA